MKHISNNISYIQTEILKDLWSFAIDVILFATGAVAAWYLPKMINSKWSYDISGVAASGLMTLVTREVTYVLTKNDRYRDIVTLGGTVITGYKALNLIQESLNQENENKLRNLNADEYLLNIINQAMVDPIEINDKKIKPVVDIIKSCTGENLNGLKMSGSSARGTATETADKDIFISMKHGSGSLEDIYNDLYECLDNKQLNPRKKNVAISIKLDDSEIDLVPGRQQNGYKNYHSLYSNKKDSWKQTNIDEHKKKVIESGRQKEIMAIRKWRDNNSLKFPSIYLDFSVVEALKYKNKGDITDDLTTVLVYLRDEFEHITILDPANSNNKISDLLDEEQKHNIARCAAKSLSKNDWNDIIW